MIPYEKDPILPSDKYKSYEIILYKYPLTPYIGTVAHIQKKMPFIIQKDGSFNRVKLGTSLNNW